MLDRLLLIALTPLALAGGTATSWMQTQWGQTQFARQRMGSITTYATLGKSSLAITKGRDGLFHTLVSINGTPVDMVVDTGASRTILSDVDASRVFPNANGDPAGQIRTFGGDRELRLQSAATVEIAGKQFRQLDAGLVKGAPVSVIGLDWLALMGPITLSADA